LTVKASQIAAGLKAKGYAVQWSQETPDQIVVSIDFIQNPELPWLRAFHLDAAGCDVETFVAEIEAWKEDVRKHLSFGVASPVVQQVIAHYGIKRTKQAIKAIEHV
jgi:hypothetical protein